MPDELHINESNTHQCDATAASGPMWVEGEMNGRSIKPRWLGLADEIRMLI